MASIPILKAFFLEFEPHSTETIIKKWYSVFSIKNRDSKVLLECKVKKRDDARGYVPCSSELSLVQLWDH